MNEETTLQGKTQNFPKLGPGTKDEKYQDRFSILAQYFLQVSKDS